MMYRRLSCLAASLLLLPLTAARADSPGGQRSYVEPDLAPTLEVYRDGDRSLVMGASTQIWAIPHVEDQALVVNDDPANAAGFRLRRARIGLQGTLRSDLALKITLNPVGGADDLVHTASLEWAVHEAATIGLGTGKVPYARSAMESSSRLRFPDRPIGTGDLSIGHRMGLTLQGSIADGALGYVTGVYNATSDFAHGNANPGLLYGGRLESAPLGPLATLTPGEFRLQIGVGGILEDGPTVNTTAYSADLHLEVARCRLRGELLVDHRAPDTKPTTPATLTGETDRQVILAEATAFLIPDTLELALRFERYDDNDAHKDHGDQQVITAGLNYYLDGHRLKAQAFYIARDETEEGFELANDAFVISVGGAL